MQLEQIIQSNCLVLANPPPLLRQRPWWNPPPMALNIAGQMLTLLEQFPVVPMIVLLTVWMPFLNLGDLTTSILNVFTLIISTKLSVAVWSVRLSGSSLPWIYIFIIQRSKGCEYCTWFGVHSRHSVRPSWHGEGVRRPVGGQWKRCFSKTLSHQLHRGFHERLQVFTQQTCLQRDKHSQQNVKRINVM